jgi:hypothetical protein
MTRIQPAGQSSLVQPRLCVEKLFAFVPLCFARPDNASGRTHFVFFHTEVGTEVLNMTYGVHGTCYVNSLNLNH